MKKKMTIIPEPKEQPKPTPPPPMPQPPVPPKQPGEYSKDNGILFMEKEFNFRISYYLKILCGI